MTLGLYVHLPFCRVHCTYCPFAISTDLTLQDRYTEALLREIAAKGDAGDGTDGTNRTDGTDGTDGTSPLSHRRIVDTVYFGGGTPSRTSIDNLTRVVAALRDTFVLAGDCEFSIEANPEDVTAESLAAWRELGVNRLSIGVQSFVDEELSAIGRIHGRERAIDAVSSAVGAGFRANLDLILGLPRQTAESFRETLDVATQLGVGHLSLYMLDLEEKTPLQVQVARGRVMLPEDDLVAEQYLDAIERLGQAGLQQYEISNFARAGEECRHNLRYWTRSEYHGLGLAAHSFLGTRRFANTRDIHRYIDASPSAMDFEEELGADEKRRELLFLQLRRTSGIHYEDIASLCGQEGIEWIEQGLRDGWLRRDGSRIAFTPAGFLQSNDFISQLF
ncbi:MAG TPA: radical SAM family heme chaperone HemW [Thermoanaerobaculia bacterium]